jgi:hypothetical protein
MLPLLADEDFNDDLREAMLGLVPDADVLTAQVVDLRETPDSEILAWAAAQGRIVLSHDASTMTAAAYERVAADLPMAGLVIVPRHAPRSAIIDDLVLIAACGEPEEFASQVVFLPFK